jgi:zinc-binding in reverse transcriptase
MYTTRARRAGLYMEARMHAEPYTWKLIWGLKGILPRVQLFLWKACHDGLPTAVVMHRRISSISPTCARCREENEFLVHMLFFCPSSRAVWFGSRLSLRIDGIPINFIHALRALMEGRSFEDQRYIANLLWCVWKARCAEVIEGIKFNPYKVCLQAVGMENAQMEPETILAQQEHSFYPVQSGKSIVLIDASWDTSGKAGAGIILYDYRGKMVEIRYFSYKAGDAMHAETLAVAAAMDQYLT